jgi:hypothetical protein
MKMIDLPMGICEMAAENEAPVQEWEKLLRQAYSTPICCPYSEYQKKIDSAFPEGWIRLECKNCGKPFGFFGPGAQKALGI